MSNDRQKKKIEKLGYRLAAKKAEYAKWAPRVDGAGGFHIRRISPEALAALKSEIDGLENQIKILKEQ